MTSTMTLNGEYTNARIHLPFGQSPDSVDEGVIEQIQEMIDSEAFTEPVEIMPDFHYGKGSVIGFTMPVGDKLVPNTIGVDIGCGVNGVCLGKDLPFGDEKFDRLFDATVKYKVPFGYESHDDPVIHMENEFDYEICSHKLENFNQIWEHADVEEDFTYDGEYFKELAENRGPGANKAICQFATLGGGNHFIEVDIDENTGEYWLVVHSGSRALGASVAEYWQTRATSLRNADGLPPVTTPDLPQEVADTGITAGDLVDKSGNIDMERVADVIPATFEGEEIEANMNRIRQIQYDRQSELEENRNTDLDYLEGEEAVGYIRDMIFCQTYAEESRKKMLSLVTEEFDMGGKGVQSTHNYIDFMNGIIRKGAIAADDTYPEMCIIPYNMADGCAIGRGLNNSEWNYSAPHGAGRKMSRTQAKNEISMEEYEDSMDGIYSSSVNEETLDEAQGAYKSAEAIERAIKGESTDDPEDHSSITDTNSRSMSGTMEIEHKLRPVLNCKDDHTYH